MAAPTIAFDAALVSAEREVSGPHLDACTVHGLDEPAPRERQDPLRPGILMPLADPAHRQYADQRRHDASRALALPLRLRRGLNRLQHELTDVAACLMTHALLITPHVPVRHERRARSARCAGSAR